MSAAHMNRALRRMSLRYPVHLVQIPRPSWPSAGPPGVIEVWRSRDYLVQVYDVRPGIQRLSVCSARVNASGQRWVDGISWDVLQRLKAECGRGDKDAVEIYPADRDVVNVANLRHLFVLDEPLNFAWRRSQSNS